MKPESQVRNLLSALLLGIKVDRVYAWRWLNIADLRSRISDVQRDYDCTVDRETKPGKRYKQYYFKSLV